MPELTPQQYEWRDLARRLSTADVVAGTRELVGVSYTIEPRFSLMDFAERKLQLGYVATELLWYVRGDMFDDSIAEKASIWRDIFDADGWAASNYGHTLFGENAHLMSVRSMLKADPTTRRAVVYFSYNHWVGLVRKDQPCTNSMQFLFRDGTLDAVVTMRSQDFIYGLGNDSPFFSFVLWAMARSLGVYVGRVIMQVGSLHVYERHWRMLDELCYPTPIDMQVPFKLLGPGEALAIIKDQDISGPFMQWAQKEAEAWK